MPQTLQWKNAETPWDNSVAAAKTATKVLMSTTANPNVETATPDTMTTKLPLSHHFPYILASLRGWVGSSVRLVFLFFFRSSLAGMAQLSEGKYCRRRTLEMKVVKDFFATVNHGGVS